jgi:superfamily II DNA or RNA helicase
MAATPKTVCADPTGAGKTVQAAGLLAYLVEAGELTLDRPAMFLTMGDQLAHQTAAELSRFLPDLTVRGLAGHRDLGSYAAEETRRRSLAEPAHVEVMTYSQWQARRHLWEGPLPVVLLDEVSELKGGKRHEAVFKTTATAERVHMFTATLYENHSVEVWTIYALLHLPQLPSLRDFGTQYVH